MKKSLYFIAGLLVAGALSVQAASVLFPYQGGTGTTTVPTLGQILVGQSTGTWGPQATGTLGLVSYTYGSSTFPSFSYASSTFASTSWVTATFPTYAYASSTFASTTFVTGNFPTFTYATATYSTYGYGTSTYLAIIGNQTAAGNKTFTGTSTFATTTTNGSSTFVGQVYMGNASSSVLSVSGASFFTGQITAGNASTTGLTSSGTLNVTGKTVLGNASTSILTATDLFASGNLAVTGTTGLTGKLTMTTGSSTVFTATNLFSSGTLNVAGQSTLATASSTALTATTLYSTNIFPAGLTSSFLAVDNTGKIIATTSPSGGVTGGTTGFLARFTSATAVSAGIFMDNNTVGGIGATSSTVLFNVRGTSGSTNTIFNVASSSNNPILSVASTGWVGLGTTTPASQLHLFSTNTSGVDPAMIFGGNSSGDTDFWVGRPNNNDTVSNDYFGIGMWSSGLASTSTQYLSIDKDGNTSVGSTTPAGKLTVLGTSGSTLPLFSVASSSASPVFQIAASGSAAFKPTATSTLAFTISNPSNSSVFTVNTTPPGLTDFMFQVATSSNDYFFGVKGNGHLSASSTAPTLSTCGGSPVVVKANDTVGRIVTGTGVITACTLTFANTYTNPPVCVANPEGGVTIFIAASTTASTVLFTGSGTITSTTITYHCFGLNE